MNLQTTNQKESCQFFARVGYILDKVLDVAIGRIDWHREPCICPKFIAQTHHVFQTDSRVRALCIVAWSRPEFLWCGSGNKQKLDYDWKTEVKLRHIEIILCKKRHLKQVEISHSSGVWPLFACIQSMKRSNVKFSRLAKNAGWNGDVL